MSKATRGGVAAAAAGLLLLVTACSGGGGAGDDAASSTPVHGGTLHIADDGEAIDLNPFTTLDNASARVLAQVVEPLFHTTADGDVVPWLAETSESSNGFTTWTFGLRQGVTFSDGTPMTADDVVYSLEAVRAEESSWAALYAEISKVEATSATTVVVTTSVPSPALEISLSLPFAAIVPEDLGGMSPEEFSKAPLGTGPFTLESWQSGQQIKLVRNDDYWDPERPYLDEVVFDAVPNDSSRAQQLRGGELDIVASPPRPQLEALDQAPGSAVGEYALAFPNYLQLNLKSAVFSNPAVREAVDLAIDRASILDAAASGHGELGGSFLAPALEYHDGSLATTEQDVDDAEQLVAQAVQGGLDPTVRMLIGAGDTYDSTAAQIIKENLEDVGFSVEIQQLDNSAHISEVASGNYDASLFTMTSDIVDPAEVVGFYLDLDALWTGGDTTRTGRLFEQAKQAEGDERGTAFQKIQQIVHDERALLVLGYQPWIWARQDDVVGFDLPPTGVPWLADVGFSAERG